MSTVLANATRFSKVGLHVKFSFCNLSPSSRTLLALALKENDTLTGFTCVGNPDGYEADVAALKDAVIQTKAPLVIWNNDDLPKDVIAAREKRSKDSRPPSAEPSSSAPVPPISPSKAPPLPPPKPSTSPSSDKPSALPLSLLSTARTAYEQAIDQGGSAPWLRSKLMMVGEGRAGKSSTVRSFLNQSFDPNLASTKGADTSSTVTVDRQEGVVNGNEWTKRTTEEEFSLMAARVVARKMRNKQEEADFSVFSSNVSSVGNGDEQHSSKDDSSGSTVRRGSFALKMVSSFRRLSVSRKELSSLSNQDATKKQQAVEPPLRMTKARPALISDEDVAKRFDADLIAEALNVEDDPTKQKLTLSIWDYGGQEVFYALHHVFLSKFGVYCVVFDMCLLAGRTSTPASQDKCLQSCRYTNKVCWSESP